MGAIFVRPTRPGRHLALRSRPRNFGSSFYRKILQGFDCGIANQRGTHWKSITERWRTGSETCEEIQWVC